MAFLAPIAFAAAKRLMRARGFGPEGLPHSAEPGHAFGDDPATAVPAAPPASGLLVATSEAVIRDRSRWHRGVGFAVAVVLLVAPVLWAYWTWRAHSGEPMPSRLSLSYVGSQIEYAGMVNDDRSRARVLETLVGVFGETNLVGDLRVDARALPPPWLSVLKSAVVAARKPGVDLEFSGNRIGVAAGTLSDGARLLGRLRDLYGSAFQVAWRGRPLSPMVLANLDTGAAADDLVTILGAWVIHFPTESDEIPIEHRPLIRRVARLMPSLPEGMAVQVSGHTDDTGDPAVNLTLSRVRAESVREALVDAGANPALVRAYGYGSERPVADNGRPEGRFLNRRIEFHVTRD